MAVVHGNMRVEARIWEWFLGRDAKYLQPIWKLDGLGWYTRGLGGGAAFNLVEGAKKRPTAGGYDWHSVRVL